MKAASVLLFATAALAAPAPVARDTAGSVSVAAGWEWRLEGLKRTCDAADNLCTWTFNLNTFFGPVMPCTFNTARRGNTPASQAPNDAGTKCAAYTITSGWDGQFGPGNGFTVLSVIDYPNKQIAWPAYTDKELVNGKVVSPDKSFPVTVMNW